MHMRDPTACLNIAPASPVVCRPKLRGIVFGWDAHNDIKYNNIQEEEQDVSDSVLVLSICRQ